MKRSVTMTEGNESSVPRWHAVGDWFDVCKCGIPCPCEFARPPTTGDCEGILAWHFRDGRYGDTPLNGLNLLAVAQFEGNIWAGVPIAKMGLYIDERADERQREALQMIFGGRAGGWPAKFAATLLEFRGVEFAPIEFEVAADLAPWRAEIPGKAVARAEALTGPTTPPGQRVQTVNPPGSEVGPGGVATWATATVHQVDGFGFKWEWSGKSSKHIPFEWSGPDES
jgi:hypothetical protein